MPSRNKRIAFVLAGVAGLALSLPAIGQRSPESLLPEGFGDTSPTPAPSPTPTPGSAPTSLLPPGPLTTDTPPPDEELAGEEQTDEEKEPPVELPDAARRPIDVVGPLNDENGGLGERAFARVNGLFLSRLMRSIGVFTSASGTTHKWTSLVLFWGRDKASPAARRLRGQGATSIC